MAVKGVNVPGYESLFLLSSTPSYRAQDYDQLTYYEQEDCTWEDFNGSLDSQFNQSLLTVGIKTSNGKTFPQSEDFKFWVLAAFALIFIRRFVERSIFQPLGRRLGIKDSHLTIDNIPCRCPRAVPSLQTAYTSNKKFSHVQLQALSKETGLKQREIERWLRRRRAVDKQSTLVKFSESCWRLVTYAFATALGIVAVWDKWWFWDFQNLWKDYPNHELPNIIWWYYLYGGSLYISFMFTQFFDVKRKDFWEMFLHHILAIGLLSITFTTNITRLGIISFLLHDCADIFIESAKMANYAKKDNLSAGIFAGFTLLWIVTRLGIFPVKIIYQSTWKTGMSIVPSHVGYSALGMLLLLFGLHVFWTYFICKMAWSAIKSGPANQKDSRSSSESSDELSSDSTSSPDTQEEVQFQEHAKQKTPRPSLQSDQITSSFFTTQRAIMRRISNEIM